MPDIFRSYIRWARGESGPFSPWLLASPAGWLYRAIARARNALYDRGVLSSADPPIPVISVGNICNGGTNKTPAVEMIARRLMALGLRVGVVSRGYGGRSAEPMEVGRGGDSSDSSVVGDEPLMLAERLPDVSVVVARDRTAGVRLLADRGADVAVADDAFQHRRLGRDADIVLIDAACPFGSGRPFPAGIMREDISSLRRADIVLITKAEQAAPGALDEIRAAISPFVPERRIFTARMSVETWLRIEDGRVAAEYGASSPYAPTALTKKIFPFSAIGSPESFYTMLERLGLDVAHGASFRDHHRFTWRDLDELERAASAAGADCFACTEKDLRNMPETPHLVKPLWVPRISVAPDDADGFWRELAVVLRPKLVVTSNGYGEDAIGALLAERLRDRFPSAQISAFPLVGVGSEYAARGVEVISPPSVMPSGGVVKYSLRALARDMRHGLGGDIKRQIEAWRESGGRYRAPICVGDVYLLLMALWGQGRTPALVATAKSVRMGGHFRVERAILRGRASAVWTRDAETAEELSGAGVHASFAGSPIMDLALDEEAGTDPWDGLGCPRVLLLPGSRPRAYDDIALLLDAVKKLSELRRISCVMVIAPTIDAARMLSSVPYPHDGDELIVGGAAVRVSRGPIASAARGADLLIGLGGTANQVCAGLGVPVVSIIEKGKLAQKKLLRDAELLVPPDAESLSRAAHELLDDDERRAAMSRAGAALLGGGGAIDAVVKYAGSELGTDARCRLWEALAGEIPPEPVIIEKNTGDTPETEDERRWGANAEERLRVARLARIARGARPR